MLKWKALIIQINNNDLDIFEMSINIKDILIVISNMKIVKKNYKKKF